MIWVLEDPVAEAERQPVLFKIGSILGGVEPFNHSTPKTYGFSV